MLSVFEKILVTTSSLALADIDKFLLVAPSSSLFLLAQLFLVVDIMTMMYSLIQAHNFFIVSGINVDGFSSFVLATHYQKRKQVDAKTSLDKVLKSSILLYILGYLLLS